MGAARAGWPLRLRKDHLALLRRWNQEQPRAVGPGADLPNPVGNEHVNLVRRFAVAVGDEYQLLAAGRELGKRAESAGEGNALERTAVAIHGVEFKLARSGVLVVGSKDDAAAASKKRRSEAGAAQIGDLPLAAAVGMHQPEVHLAGFDQALRQ